MDYDLDVVLIALVGHRRFQGGTEHRVTAYANDLFDRYNKHIVKAAAGAGLALDEKQRSVVAAIAAFTPGTTAKDQALDAIATYVDLLDS